MIIYAFYYLLGSILSFIILKYVIYRWFWKKLRTNYDEGGFWFIFKTIEYGIYLLTFSVITIGCFVGFLVLLYVELFKK